MPIQNTPPPGYPPLPGSPPPDPPQPCAVVAETPLCGLCGHPMPDGEEIFQYHGYSGGCPKDQNPAQTPLEKIAELEQKKVGATDDQRDTINGEILEQDAKLIGITLPSDVKQRPGKGDL
jgi:hypothetical protein